MAEDFEQIVRRFAALVLCECRRVTGNVYDAEDASQLVFLALAMEIKSGTRILQPGAWLKRVSRRQALKIVRSRSRRKRREDAVRREELQTIDTDSPLDQNVIAGIIRDAIDQLPERYRMAVILHYFGGMTLELIAVELKISRQAVGTRLHRGRKMLGERLAGLGVRLDNGALATALGVIVPAAVVSAMVRSAQRLASPASASVPMRMTGMLQAIASVAVHRPLRFAAVAAAAMALGGSGMAVVEDAGAIQQLNPLSALRWLHRFAQEHRPQFKTPSLPRISSASKSPTQTVTEDSKLEIPTFARIEAHLPAVTIDAPQVAVHNVRNQPQPPVNVIDSQPQLVTAAHPAPQPGPVMTHASINNLQFALHPAPMPQGVSIRSKAVTIAGASSVAPLDTPVQIADATQPDRNFADPKGLAPSIPTGFAGLSGSNDSAGGMDDSSGGRPGGNIFISPTNLSGAAGGGSVTPIVPEPAAGLLLAATFALLSRRRRRR
jgi:RNA polymerase sigma-70 factor (ECF subfamily)